MIEIERKFLVKPSGWPKGQRQIRIVQGYMVRTDGMVVRVRQKDELCFLSLKARIDQRSSYDFEYEIPTEHARAMFDNICVGCVHKTRHVVEHGALDWEIDEFHDDNHGLVVAEIELPSSEFEFQKPSWLGEEVTEDARYRNASLSQHPYCDW